MIVAISFHDGDLDLMTRWARHVAKLGTYPKHSIVLAPVHEVYHEDIEAILKPVFGNVHIQPCFHTESGWPISCNKAFENIAIYVEMKAKQPFLFMEPDAVPLVPSWIDDIEAEYLAKRRPFMGDFVGIKGVFPNGIDHMSGIAVYSPNLSFEAPSIFRNETNPWDVASAKEVVPKMARTRLIHHDWVPSKEWRRDKVDASCVRAGAVVYHPDKLGVLFNDGAVSLTRVGGEPQTGAGMVVPESSFEHKEAALPIKAGTPYYVEGVIVDQINSLSFHCQSSPKLKKLILAKLNETGIIKIKPKAKKSKQPRNKVLKNLAVS